MITGTLSSGFVYQLEDDVLDNMELVDALAEAEDDNAASWSRIVLLLLGKEQRKALYDHLRKDTGRVPIMAVVSVVSEILAGTAKGKN